MADQFKVDPSYVEVADRIAEFRQRHPEGCLRPHDPDRPYKLETLGDRIFVVYTACAYRHPDDPLPGVGVAWEPFPGRTPYTRDSELQNAETSAWGRAIVAVLASSSKKVASADEVRLRGGGPHVEDDWARRATQVVADLVRQEDDRVQADGVTGEIRQMHPVYPRRRPPPKAVPQPPPASASGPTPEQREALKTRIGKMGNRGCDWLNEETKKRGLPNLLTPRFTLAHLEELAELVGVAEELERGEDRDG